MSTFSSSARSSDRFSDAEPRYLADVGNRRVHDLEHEQTQCKLCEIDIEHRLFFSALEDANEAGFRSCTHCLA